MCLRYCYKCLTFILFGRKKKKKKKFNKNKQKKKDPPPELDINDLIDTATFAVINGTSKDKQKIANLLKNNKLVIGDNVAEKLIDEYNDRKFSLPGITSEEFNKKSKAKKKKILTEHLQEQFQKNDSELLRTAVILRKSKIAEQILEGVNNKKISLASFAEGKLVNQNDDAKDILVKKLEENLVKNKDSKFTLEDIIKKPNDVSKILEKYTTKFPIQRKSINVDNISNLTEDIKKRNISIQRESLKSNNVSNVIEDLKKRKFSLSSTWGEPLSKKVDQQKEEILLAILEGKIKSKKPKKSRNNKFAKSKGTEAKSIKKKKKV